MMKKKFSIYLNNENHLESYPLINEDINQLVIQNTINLKEFKSYLCFLREYKS